MELRYGDQRENRTRKVKERIETGNLVICKKKYQREISREKKMREKIERQKDRKKKQKEGNIHLKYK